MMTKKSGEIVRLRQSRHRRPSAHGRIGPWSCFPCDSACDPTSPAVHRRKVWNRCGSKGWIGGRPPCCQSASANGRRPRRWCPIASSTNRLSRRRASCAPTAWNWARQDPASPLSAGRSSPALSLRHVNGVPSSRAVRRESWRNPVFAQLLCRLQPRAKIAAQNEAIAGFGGPLRAMIACIERALARAWRYARRRAGPPVAAACRAFWPCPIQGAERSEFRALARPVRLVFAHFRGVVALFDAAGEVGPVHGSEGVPVELDAEAGPFREGE